LSDLLPRLQQLVERTFKDVVHIKKSKVNVTKYGYLFI
jgi:hypothetical protein